MTGTPQPKSLDEKLKAIPIEFLRGVPVYLPDKAVAAIKQVLKEQGQATVRKDRYRDPKGREYTQYTISYADGSGEFVRAPQFNYMTGTEFYECFKAELGNSSKLKETDGTYSVYGPEWVERAAKRAAGLSDSKETPKND